MRKAILYTLILPILLPATSLACSCGGSQYFCETASARSESIQVIVKGVKIREEYYGMDVKILDVISGTEDRDTIRVWGDNGALCRWYVQDIPGDTVIFTFIKTDKAGNGIATTFPDTLEKEGHYHISVCGNYWLPVVNNQVQGKIDPSITGDQAMPYNEFVEFIQDCHSSTNSISERFKPQVVIFPNPVNSQLFINLSNDTYLTANLYNATGQLAETFVLHKAQNKVSMASYSPGVYYLRLNDKTGSYVETKKIFIQ